MAASCCLHRHGALEVVVFGSLVGGEKENERRRREFKGARGLRGLVGTFSPPPWSEGGGFDGGKGLDPATSIIGC